MASPPRDAQNKCAVAGARRGGWERTHQRAPALVCSHLTHGRQNTHERRREAHSARHAQRAAAPGGGVQSLARAGRVRERARGCVVRASIGTPITLLFWPASSIALALDKSGPPSRVLPAHSVRAVGPARVVQPRPAFGPLPAPCRRCPGAAALMPALGALRLLVVAPAAANSPALLRVPRSSGVVQLRTRFAMAASSQSADASTTEARHATAA